MFSNLRSRRAMVAAVAALAVLGGSATLLATSASAEPSAITIEPLGKSAAAGTCATFTVTPTGAVNSDTITVSIDEGTSSATQDVDFCTIPGVTTPHDERPGYFNGNIPSERMRYESGRSVTSSSSLFGVRSGSDDPSNAQQSDADPAPRPTTNPSGVDSVNYYYKGVPIVVGVAGLIPGSAGVVAYVDKLRGEVKQGNVVVQPASQNFVVQSDEVQSPRAILTITAGGLPGTQAAADAVAGVDATPESASASQGTVQQVAVRLTNASGDTVFGVRPVLRVISGPNVAANDQLRTDCTETDNSGNATCLFQGRNAGTDTIAVFVNQTGGSAALDPKEPRDEILRTTVRSGTKTGESFARYVDLAPESATTAPGGSQTFVASVTDVDGFPVQGVNVRFDESGPGQFADGASPVTKQTDAFGVASVEVRTATGDMGTQSVTATISNVTTQCARPAGDPAGAAAGRCTDTAVHTISAASPSPSPSATPTASVRPSTSATPTATSSRSPAACQITTVRVNTRTINATGLANVTVTGARPNSNVQLQGYSQNHFGTANFFNDPTPVDRSGVADANGSITFTDLRPASNTRLRARMTGCTYTDQTDVIEVRAQETLEVRRTGTRSYTFSGRSIPAREGGLIVSLYRIVGAACGPGVEPRSCPGEVFVGQGRAVALGSPGEGLYSIRITFPARDNNVRDEFVVKTGRDAQNAPGRSNARSLLIF